MAIHVLIDGDWILYAAGFAGQKTFYVQPLSTGPEEFSTLTDLRSNPRFDIEAPVYSRIVLDPPAHFFHSAKRMISSQLEKVHEKFGEEVHYEVLIDGDGNFRNKIATLAPYKGNRAPDSKPKMYNELRGYLLDVWKADVVHDQETDDEMTIRQTAYMQAGEKSVIVGVDKDYLQCPGWILNPNKGFHKVHPQEGLWRLHVQCLTGDSSDNIPGAYMVGPKAAQKMVPKNGTPRQMWDAVLDGYAKSMLKYPDHYPKHVPPHIVALENMRLVYLRRQPNEMWNPPGKET